MLNGLDKFSKKIKIEHSLAPSNEDIEFLTKQINHETSEMGSAYPFAFFARNEASKIIAGCNGSVVFGSIYTDQLWVHPDWRKNNLGRKLMEHVHDYGREIGCKIATVATMSFQNSREFYEKLGYKVDFERSGYVNNSSCLFLRMELNNSRTRIIQLAFYNHDWPRMFEAESIKIKEAFGGDCIAVHHVGSTSVPGLAAKPKIDIIVVVKPFTPLQWSAISMKNVFTKLGYTYKGEWNIPFKYGFTKRGDVDVNLHAYEEGHPEIELTLLFRDYLLENDDVCNEYATLKENILRDPLSSEKSNSIFPTYTLRKNDFILKVLKKSGFNRLRLLKCTHYSEIEAAKKFRQKYFFDNVPIDDPYLWTFNHPEHVHFVFYQGIKIIGYAHIQLWPNARVAMRIIVIDAEKRNQGFGRQFLQLIEKWLKKQDYQTIHTESSPAALQFYEKNGYCNMPFNNPDDDPSDPCDIPMGKNL